MTATAGGTRFIFAKGSALLRDASSVDRVLRVGFREHDAVTFLIRPPQYSPKHAIGRHRGRVSGMSARLSTIE